MSTKRKSNSQTESVPSKVTKASGSPKKKEITFVTGNANKLREVCQILGPKYQKMITNKALDLVEIQGTMDQVSISKCREAFTKVDGPVLVEDTCLFFNALKGLPGPYIKSFMESVGTAGLPKLLTKFEDKTARAVCTFGFFNGEKGQDVHLLKGVVEGSIASEPRGSDGFGWDPIFIPEGFTKTFAEMSKEEKNLVSHRFRALEELRKFLDVEMSEDKNGKPGPAGDA